MTTMFPVNPDRSADSKRFSFLDLFCGAGGFSLGFEKAGFQCVGAAEFDRAAVDTHLNNFACPVQQLDLSVARASLFPAADVIIGGPPCQGFSSAGLRDELDARNDLVACFASLVSALRPAAFVFENVEGFITVTNGHYLFALLRPLIACGYNVQVKKVNAANYGVPQHRKRIIVIGGFRWKPSFPPVTHSAFGAPGAELAGCMLPRTPTLADALHDLPPASANPPGPLQGHYYRPLEGTDLERALVLGPGQSMRDLPLNLQHQSFERRAFRRVKDGTPTERRGGAPTGVRRLRADEPSKAITGGARAEFLHPQANRPLTLRECARLQTFPDDFAFYGTSSQQSQLIGNAVPPTLAQAIAKNLYHDLTRNIPERIEPRTGTVGRLLSFVPTLSDGASPALKRVMDLVVREFGPLEESSTVTSTTLELPLC